MSSTLTTVSPLTQTGNSDSSERRTPQNKRSFPSSYEPNGTVPVEELMKATTPGTPRTAAKLRRTRYNGDTVNYKVSVEPRIATSATAGSRYGCKGASIQTVRPARPFGV
eukprot:479626-Amphidinium_carterae.1